MAPGEPNPVDERSVKPVDRKRKMTQAAYTEIGEHFGGRNHSTVMSAEKRVRSLLEANATVKAGNQDWKLGDLLASLEQQLLTG